jgi:hypothetical protein
MAFENLNFIASKMSKLPIGLSNNQRYNTKLPADIFFSGSAERLFSSS